MVLDDIQKRSVFKALATKGQLEVGREFGFDKFHRTPAAIRSQVNLVYRQVMQNPELYAVSPDVLKIVEEAMTSRRNTHVKTTEEIEQAKVSERDLVVGAGTKAWVLLNKKLDNLAKNKKAFDEESLMNIAKMAGIVFDKSQIVKGEATEHIALKAHISQDITPQQAIEQLLKMRESATSEE